MKPFDLNARQLFDVCLMSGNDRYLNIVLLCFFLEFETASIYI